MRLRFYHNYFRDFTDTPLTGPVVNDTNLALKGILGIRVSFVFSFTVSSVNFGLGHGGDSQCC
jgi:hypothetical protein